MKTIKVTVSNLSASQKGFFLDGNPAPRFTLLAGETYFFDQSDPSNGMHPVRLSLQQDGKHVGAPDFTQGVTFKNPPLGTSGAGLELKLAADTPNLHFFCGNHPGMGGSGKLFIATNGNDTLQGTDLADSLNGFGGNDRIFGAGGDDTLDGGLGNDSLFGGLGNDRLIGGPGSNTLDGGTGTDLADYSTLATAHRLDLAKGTATSTGINDRLISIENASGGLKNDLLIGNFSANVLAGGVGNDSLHGGGGLDSLDGGPGKDFLSAFTGGATLRGGVDNDILEIVSKRYEVVSGQFTWDQARRDAESRGGQLATIKDQAEWDTVSRVIPASANENWWMGASDDPNSISGASEGKWKWIDGTPFDFTIWGGGKPSGNYLGVPEHHLQVRGEWGGKWNDESGKNLSSYIIERNLPATTSTALNLLDGGDGADLLRGGDGAENLLGGAGDDTIHGGTGANTISGGTGNDLLTSAGTPNSYTAIPGSFTFDQAKVDAVKLGGHLATIGSAAEWEKIKLALPAGRGWLGASDARKEGAWEWIDGTPWTFDNWNSPSEPSNRDPSGNPVEHYLEIRSEADRKWNDASGTITSNFYILEIENAKLDNSSLSGGAGNDTLSAGPGNDTLVGCNNGSNGGRAEIDTLSGGLGKDIFHLGWSNGRFYDDGNTRNAGRGDYALITDFTVGQDKLQLDGARGNYYLGASGVSGVSGIGLYAEQGANDELIAIIRSANGTTLTAENTINTGLFV